MKDSVFHKINSNEVEERNIPGLERWLKEGRALTILPEDPCFVLAHTWQFTSVCISKSRVFNALLLYLLAEMQRHTCRQNARVYEIKLNYKRILQELSLKK